jgi:hypothetical protein
MEKNPSTHLNLERQKKQGTLTACLGLHIGYMKFLFPKEFITILVWANTPCKEHPTYWGYLFM